MQKNDFENSINEMLEELYTFNENENKGLLEQIQIKKKLIALKQDQEPLFFRKEAYRKELASLNCELDKLYLELNKNIESNKQIKKEL